MLTFNRNLSVWAASVNSQGRVSSRECSSWYDIPANSAIKTNQNYPKSRTLFFPFDSLSHLVQRFFGVHQPRGDPVQPVQSSWPVTSVRHDGMWASSWSRDRLSANIGFMITGVWLCRSEKVRRSGGSPIRSLSWAPMGSASLWWWPQGTCRPHTRAPKWWQNCDRLFVCSVTDGIELVSSFESLFLSFLCFCAAVCQKWSAGWRTSAWPSTCLSRASLRTLTCSQLALLTIVSLFISIHPSILYTCLSVFGSIYHIKRFFSHSFYFFTSFFESYWILPSHFPLICWSGPTNQLFLSLLHVKMIQWSCYPVVFVWHSCCSWQ